MRITRHLAAFTLAAVTVTAAAASIVSGTVRTADTHVPLSSMVVSAYDAGGSVQGTATTDSAGHYALSLQNGEYRILAYDPAGVYATSFDGDADSFETSPVTSVSAQPLVVNFSLRLGGRVTGTVWNSAGLPLQEATVAAYNDSGTRRAFTMSNGAGAYSIVLAPGSYRIVAYDDVGFFAPRFYPDQYGFNQAASITVGAGQTSTGKDIHLEIAAHLGGTVSDFDTHAPLEGMTVYAYTDGMAVAQADTNANGAFRLNVSAGSYRLVATDRSLGWATGFLGDSESFESSLAVPVVAAQSRLDLDIPLHRGGTASGQVAGDGQNGLGNITLAAYNADGSQRTTSLTAADGSYRLVLPAGQFRIAAFDTQRTWATQFYRMQTAFGDASPVNVIPQTPLSSIDFALARAGRIRGTVLEAVTGAPAYAVDVAAYDDGEMIASARADESGAYTLVLPPGTYRIAVFDSALRYATVYSGGAATFDDAEPIALAAGGERTLDFRVQRGVRAGGRVIDPSGTPLSDIEIRVFDPEGRRVATTIASSGGFEMVLLPATYKLQAVDLTGRRASAYYNQESSFENATPWVVQAGASPPPVTFILTRATGRRHAAPH